MIELIEKRISLTSKKDLPEAGEPRQVVTVVAEDGGVSIFFWDGESWGEGNVSLSETLDDQGLPINSAVEHGDSVDLVAPVYDPRIVEGTGRPVLTGRERNWGRWGDDDVHYRHAPAPNDGTTTLPSKK